VKASDLDRRIEIFKTIITEGDFGRTNISYEKKGETRARVNFSSGNRIVENDEIFFTVEREFIVRSYVDISDTDIIRFEGNDWRVLSIDRVHDYNNIIIRTTKINQ